MLSATVGAAALIAGGILALSGRDATKSKSFNHLQQAALERFNAKACDGTGQRQLVASPMRLEDTAMILPLGLMVGAHVTPIDHQYFSPADFGSPRDAYEVYAMADGYITQIQRRSVNVDTGMSKKEEFRYTFEHSCTFFTYFDLVTSVAPEILSQAPDLQKTDYANVRIPVKAGQVVGRIGGQTLDTAVYNLEKQLPGFVTPSLYEFEPWKVFTDAIYEYYPEPLRSQLLAKSPRQATPRGGKIDYDVDGKLVGNWFREGTNGYAGTDRHRYWTGHLAIVYDAYDPTQIQLSFGDFGGQTKQFGATGNAPDPATVSPASGVVTYELEQYQYIDTQSGQHWDRRSLAPGGLRAENFALVQGTVLFQLLENRRLKMEVFPGKTASQVQGFTPAALIYVR